MPVTIGRRELVAALGSVAVWPLAARAQQPAMPVIGVLDSVSVDFGIRNLPAFRQSLGEEGYVEGQNVAIEYRWAEGRYDRLPELAADLVRRRVSVIVANSTPASLAAKAATSTIPIVFFVGDDPVKLGLVASLGQPGGNATGVNFFVGELAAKRLGLLRELVPSAARVAVLVNPSDPVRTASNLRDVETAARAIGLQIQVLKANTVSEIDMAFTTLARERGMPSSSFQTRSSTAGVCNLPSWQRAIRFPPPSGSATSSRSGG